MAVMQARTSDILAGLTDREIDAMVELMLLAAFADGSLDQAESAVIKRSLLGVEALWLSHTDLEERMAKAKDRIKEEGREVRLSRLRTLLAWPEQRLVALQLAIRIVEADGVVQGSERELLLQAAEALGVRDDVASRLGVGPIA
jgi:uncharacterized tellurite resistance protein B-like protein